MIDLRIDKVYKIKALVKGEAYIDQVGKTMTVINVIKDDDGNTLAIQST